VRRRSLQALAGAAAVGGLAAIAAIVATPDGRQGPRPASACDRTASTTAALTHQFAQATAGQTICLAPGRYGTFRAGAKDAPVTVRSRSGRSASMALAFDAAANVHVDRVTITNADIGANSRNVTVSRSRFTGLAVIHAGRIANANIVFDRNTHVNIDTCTKCFQGRVHVDPVGREPSGVTIERSLFVGGNSDGVRADAVSVRVIGNEFRDFRDQDPFHTDPIQIYGGSRVLIRGNYFHHNFVSAAIMMADGGDHNVVEDNVIAAGKFSWAMTWYSDNGSIIRHNTFDDGACEFHVRCGIINLGAKPGDPRGRGTIIRDNVLAGVGGGGQGFTAEDNLSATSIPGRGNVTGRPTYKGPITTYGGHRLARRSLGVRDASDGTDRGIR
jgi:hypothetical protein